MYTEKYKTLIKETEEDTNKWKEVIKLKSLEWTLIQSDWCPYKKRICGNRETAGFSCTGKGHMKRQQYASPGERPQKKSSFDPGSLASGIIRKTNFCCLNHSVSL